MTPTGPSVRIAWLGHATALIDIGGVRLLTDPVLRDRIGPLVRISDSVPGEALGRVDGVLLSHLHADHADPRSLRSIAREVPVIAPRPAARWLQRNGIEHVTELSPGDAVPVCGLSVRATPAMHHDRRYPAGPRADPIGFVVGAERSVYFAGDTDLFDAMTELCGRVDVALIPVWGWGRSLGPGHMDPERAARAVAMIRPRVAIPIHWGTFAPAWPARRPFDPSSPPRRFAELIRNQVPGVEVRLLSPGDWTEL